MKPLQRSRDIEKIIDGGDITVPLINCACDGDLARDAVRTAVGRVALCESQRGSSGRRTDEAKSQERYGSDNLHRVLYNRYRVRVLVSLLNCRSDNGSEKNQRSHTLKLLIVLSRSLLQHLTESEFDVLGAGFHAWICRYLRD